MCVGKMTAVAVFDGDAGAEVSLVGLEMVDSRPGRSNVDSSDMDVVVELGVPGASDGVGGPAGGRLIRVGA